jgi:hypothetical protein
MVRDLGSRFPLDLGRYADLFGGAQGEGRRARGMSATAICGVAQPADAGERREQSWGPNQKIL